MAKWFAIWCCWSLRIYYFPIFSLPFSTLLFDTHKEVASFDAHTYVNVANIFSLNLLGIKFLRMKQIKKFCTVEFNKGFANIFLPRRLSHASVIATCMKKTLCTFNLCLILDDVDLLFWKCFNMKHFMPQLLQIVCKNWAANHSTWDTFVNNK